MNCLNCNKSDISDKIGLCVPCDTLYKIGMLKASVKEVIIDWRIQHSEASRPDDTPVENNSVPQARLAIESVEKTEKKSSIKTLFDHEANIISQPTFESALSVAKSQKISVRTLFTLQESYESHPPISETIEHTVQITSRPAIVQEIAEEQRILSGEEIARISLAREQSLNNIIAIKKQQGEYDVKQADGTMRHYTVYDAIEEQLRHHIHDLDKKMAALKVCKTVARRIQNNFRAEEIEKLSPEELEDFKRRAKKTKDPSKAISKAKSDALAKYSKEQKQAFKMLDSLGYTDKIIAMVVDTFGISDEECRAYIEERNPSL